MTNADFSVCRPAWARGLAMPSLEQLAKAILGYSKASLLAAQQAPSPRRRL